MMNNKKTTFFTRRLLHPILALALALLIVTTVYAAWNTPVTVDSTNDVGYFTSLAVVNGNPAISYYDNTNDNLEYVRATDASGSSGNWGSPVTVDSTDNVGRYTSLAVVNGNPAISYYDSTNGDLKYARATDASGSSWITMTVDSTDVVGEYNSLAVVNGNPAISYYDSTNGDLKYARATDASGSSWITMTVAITDVVGLHTSLVVVNGNPAISYYDQTNGNLEYVRASNADGSSWDSPVTVDSTDNVGFYTSLAADVNGNPAISYTKLVFFGADSLKYVRATDASGSSGNWGSPVTVDSLSGSIGDISLAVVSGNPAISYKGYQNLDLKYTRASDANGTTWNNPAPGAVDSTGNVGGYTSLAADVNGNPAISYYDSTNGDLKYVRSPNPTAIELQNFAAHPAGGVNGLALPMALVALGVGGLALLWRRAGRR